MNARTLYLTITLAIVSAVALVVIGAAVFVNVTARPSPYTWSCALPGASHGFVTVAATDPAPGYCVRAP